MKKSIVCFILFCIILYSGFAQSNNVNRLIGTWIDNEVNTQWVFNSNGTITINGQNFRYGATDTMIVILFSSNNIPNISSSPKSYNYSISSDGRTLIFLRGDGSTFFWLTKQ